MEISPEELFELRVWHWFRHESFRCAYNAGNAVSM
jgi:hypothetical protein